MHTAAGHTFKYPNWKYNMSVCPFSVFGGTFAIFVFVLIFSVGSSVAMHLLLCTYWSPNEAAGIKHNGFYSVNCVRISCWIKHNSFSPPSNFWWKDSTEKFLFIQCIPFWCYKFIKYLMQKLVTFYPLLYYESCQSTLDLINGRLIQCITKTHV